MEGVEVYKGFQIKFVFPHYYVSYNNKDLWTDISEKDCKAWVDGLLNWCHGTTP